MVGVGGGGGDMAVTDNHSEKDTTIIVSTNYCARIVLLQYHFCQDCGMEERDDF